MLEGATLMSFIRIASLVASAMVLAAPIAEAASVKENNKAADPPLYSLTDTTCTASPMFKPVLSSPAQHSFIVVKGPDGKMLELRAGPAKGGPAGTLF
jgi:hypothetical protein